MIQLIAPPRPCPVDQSADTSYENQTLADISRREFQHEAAAQGYPTLQAKGARGAGGTADESLRQVIPLLQQLYARIQEDEGPPVEPTYITVVDQPGLALTRLGKQVVGTCHDVAWQEAACPGWGHAYVHYRLEPIVALMLRALSCWGRSICLWGTSSDTLVIGSQTDAVRDLQALVGFVRRMGRSQAFRNLQHEHRRTAEKNFRSGCKYTTALFKAHPSMLILRIDLYYQPDPVGFSYGQAADSALDGYLRALRRGRVIPGYLGSMIKRAAGPDRGMHYHVVVYVKARLHRIAWFLTRALGERWRDQIGRGKGGYFNCYSWRARFDYNGLGLVHVADVVKLGGVRLLIWFMSKHDCRLKVGSSKAKDFWRSKMPTVPEDGGTPAAHGTGLVKRMLGGARSQYPKGLAPAPAAFEHWNMQTG